MALVRSWNRQGSRSQSLSAVLKKLFHTMTKLNIDLHLTFVPSSQNQADSPSRRLSLQDAKLCPSLSAEARLKLYLKEAQVDEGEALHSFRLGSAITLALSGSQLADAMSLITV